MGEAAGEVTGWEDRPEGANLTADAGPTGDPEVDQLVEEIEVTRVEMTGTVEQIGDRLDPKNIVADAKETVREATVGKVENMANTAGEMVSNAGQTAQEAGSGLVQTIRRNPIPAAMAGIGLGWLAMSARSSGSGSNWSNRQYTGGRYSTDRYAGYEGYGASGTWDTGAMGGNAWAAGGAQPSGQMSGGQGIGDKVGQVGETAGQAVSDVQQRAGEVVGQVGQTVGQTASQVGQTASQVPQQVQGVARQVGDNAGRMFQDNPLAMGAIAVAVGTAIGMVLPTTQVERQVIGKPASQVMEKAEEAASQALGQVEQTAREAEDQAREQDMQARAH
jgi:ElaB/YqjD/DUF883 family membrane-anchored ribosome-binding protein